MTNMTTTTTKTRLAQGTDAIETAVAINWENASVEDMRALATRTIIIAAQAQWRTAGAIPTSVTLDAHAFANPERTRKPHDAVAAAKSALAKMSPEERAAFLASLA